MTTTFIDTHCHLDHSRYDHEQTDELIARAGARGVSKFVTIGCASTVENVNASTEIARRFRQQVRATVGVHPHDASQLTDRLLGALEKASNDALVVAIGETGLDFHYDHSPRAEQREAFRRQIDLAKRVSKPLIIHTRNAAKETLEILKEEDAKAVGGIIHCFSEDADFARRALELGFVSSFSGLVTFRRGAESIREAAAKQPSDAILIETDAPFLAPVPHRGKRNEPAYVVDTATALAELRNQPLDELAAQTTENAFRIFGRW